MLIAIIFIVTILLHSINNGVSAFKPFIFTIIFIKDLMFVYLLNFFGVLGIKGSVILFILFFIWSLFNYERARLNHAIPKFLK